jgi:hypothetical protein
MPAPGAASAVTVTARGASATEALARAALVAEQIANDDIMMAVLPERSIAAIAAVKRLSLAAAEGPDALRDAWSEMRGPGRDRIARVLARETMHESACEEVGFLPFAALAAKYGPGIAKAAYKKISSKVKERRAKKARAAAAARARAAAAARARAAAAREPVEQDESDEPVDEMTEAAE